jgi:hypothetical protein
MLDDSRGGALLGLLGFLVACGAFVWLAVWVIEANVPPAPESAAAPVEAGAAGGGDE